MRELEFFQFSHLPEKLQKVAAPFCDLAAKIVETLPRNYERQKALDRLLEAKDAAVRAMLSKPVDRPVSSEPYAGMLAGKHPGFDPQEHRCLVTSWTGGRCTHFVGHKGPCAFEDE